MLVPAIEFYAVLVNAPSAGQAIFSGGIEIQLGSIVAGIGFLDGFPAAKHDGI